MAEIILIISQYNTYYTYKITIIFILSITRLLVLRGSHKPPNMQHNISRFFLLLVCAKAKRSHTSQGEFFDRLCDAFTLAGHRHRVLMVFSILNSLISASVQRKIIGLGISKVKGVKSDGMCLSRCLMISVLSFEKAVYALHDL
jgi:hypothetical protein